ncbi:MAG TPA: DNA repair protein RadC [Bacilli bacterium]|nr:DNA repair protein RadC [Bacilli bacterium]
MSGSSPKIKDIPLYQRPREKAMRYGINSLSNVELLAIIINSGTKRDSALKIAENLLIKYQGLTKMANFTETTDFSVHGIKDIKAITLLAAFKLSERIQKENYNELLQIESSSDIANKYLYDFSSAKNEMLLIVALDKSLKILKEQILYVGTKSGFMIDTKQMKELLIKVKAKFYILVHNHPSGTAYPSFEDIQSTKAIKTLTSKIDIFLYDHLVIAGYSYFSMRDNELI